LKVGGRKGNFYSTRILAQFHNHRLFNINGLKPVKGGEDTIGRLIAGGRGYAFRAETRGVVVLGARAERELWKNRGSNGDGGG